MNYHGMWTMETLSTITSRVLRTVSLSFGGDLEALEKFEWDGLDRLFSKPQFSDFGKLTITYLIGVSLEPAVKNEEDLAKIVRLPRLRGRGDILRFQLEDRRPVDE
jgi:hypothetical protein